VAATAGAISSGGRREPTVGEKKPVMDVAMMIAAILSLSAVGSLAALAAQSPQPDPRVEVVDFAAKTIYHSPETPGYTSWVGLWRAHDGHLRCSFNQQTGPKDKPVSQFVVLDSRDAGATWKRVEGDLPHGGGRGMVVLKDGALVRWDGSGYMVRSTDGGKTWVDHVDLMPPKEYQVWPSMMHQLRDGRLVLMAGVWRRGDGPVANPRMTKMMFVSADGGRSWSKPVTLMPTEQGVCEEGDFCEQPNRDLFWVHRVEHFPATRTEIGPLAARMGEPFPNGYSDRMQSIVHRKGAGWEPGPAVAAPFHHSGYPSVIRTREGLILHLATDGIYWTADIGKTWTRLPVRGTAYYPQTLQLRDGKIICIGHVGSDDVYGTVDQSILQLTFRIKVTRER
jgi:hypothetical protein